MARERTLVLAKPDAVRRALAGEIIARLERRGLEIKAARLVTVDRSLVQGLGRDGEHAAMLGGIVGLAHALGLTTVAEGIEAVGQVDRLRALGCDAGQGFFFARPGDAEALVGLLGARA